MLRVEIWNNGNLTDTGTVHSFVMDNEQNRAFAIVQRDRDGWLMEHAVSACKVIKDPADTCTLAASARAVSGAVDEESSANVQAVLNKQIAAWCKEIERLNDLIAHATGASAVVPDSSFTGQIKAEAQKARMASAACVKQPQIDLSKHYYLGRHELNGRNLDVFGEWDDGEAVVYGVSWAGDTRDLFDLMSDSDIEALAGMVEFGQRSDFP
jgi:hypothetical protein